MKYPARGFTLIELLVVIAIMTVIGAFTLANYRSFGEDQNLKNAVLDIQSQLRTAQTNATSNTKCVSGFGATWQVEFANVNTINLKCSASTNPQKALQLVANITIQPVSGIGSNCPPAPPFTINFDPLTGKVGLGDIRCTALTITLRNNKTGSTQSLGIEQGGRIYAQ